jgi:hypothetical protein
MLFSASFALENSCFRLHKLLGESKIVRYENVFSS